MEKLLNKLNACSEAVEWARGKTWPEIYKSCQRGDWLMWLFGNTMLPDQERLLFLVKGKQAETVINLMKDKRSIDAVKKAIDYGLGKIDKTELEIAAGAAAAAAACADAASDASAADAAYAAYAAAAACADAAYAAASAAYAAAAACADAAYAAYAAASASDASASAADARKENLRKTADIVRQHIPIDQFNIKL